MLKRLIIFIMALFPFFASGRNSDKDIPDFAFPKQVIKDADARLEKALREGDGNATVTALIQSGLAQTAISGDSVPSVIRRIESVAAAEKNVVTCALLNLLTAEIYTQYYQQNSYNLDRRPALAVPGDDITLWSGKEFKDTIIGLYEAALTHAPELRRTRVADYPSVIETDKVGAIFYPTLFDFASVRAVDGISGLTNETMQVLSPLFLTKINLRFPNVLSKPSRIAITIADRWAEANSGAPRIAALLQRYDLLSNYIVSDDEEDTAFSPLLQLYRENASTPYAVELLLRSNYYSMSQAQRAEVYNLLKDFEAANPSYIRINAVKNMIDRLSLQEMSVSYPSQVARGRKFDVEVSMTNINSAEILVYRVRPSEFCLDDYSYRLSECESTPVARIPVSNSAKVPFAEKCKVSCQLDEYGVYVIVSSLTDRKSKEYFQPVYCSDMALTDVRGSNVMNVYAVDGQTGAPVQGADITTYHNGDSLRRLKTRTTAADGSVTVTPGSLRDLLIQATKGRDRFSAPMSEYISRYATPGRNTVAFVRTSLAIYHPGDSLDFVAVMYDIDGNKRSLLRDTRFRAVLRNPNYVSVDTVEVMTDNYGRATGKFLLPSDGLTGNFVIQITAKKDSKVYGSERVMVSDYKLPTYEAKVDSVAIDSASGSVVVYGNALTYSGFPVQNAVVEATLEALQRSWWYPSSVKFHTDTLTTDAEGRFRWELSREVLDESPFINGRYRASFTVTSPSGENRICQDTFTLSDEASITVDDPWLAADRNATVRVAVLDALGNPVDTDVRLKFTATDGKEYYFDAASRGRVAKVDLSALSSATYTLEVTAPSVNAEPLTTTMLVYNASDKASPVTTGLWTPAKSIKADAATRTAEIVYGVASAQPHVLMTISHAGSVISSEWIKAETGMNRLSVTVPDSISDMSVRLSSVTDFKASELTFAVTVDNPDNRLNVRIERMRDKLVPLAPETLTVKVTNGAGTGVGAAVILDMYSKALDNLASLSWQFIPSSFYIPGVNFGNNLSGEVSYRYSGALKRAVVDPMNAPQFNFYGMSWAGYSNGMIFGYAAGIHIRGTSKNAMYKMEGVMESAEEECEADECMLAESVVTSSADTTFDAGSAEGVAEAPEVEQYRPSEVPLAFFAPMLSTDADGSLTYSFTVPNANTTWVLNALAYNNILASSLDVREAIASKPVMVEPNLPRFLRTGDVADIRVAVMNATDEAASVTTEFEISDPSTGEVIDTQSVVSEIAPRTSATVQFRINAPASEGALVVKVKSSTATYSDGVRTLLPVLSSSQPVIDATTFYLAPGQKEFTEDIPASPSGSQVTLSFCENPTWEVVSALPGLRADDGATSIAASARVFAGAVSRYVLSLNPAIEPALREWLASGADEGQLLSMLSRNEDLKQLVLASTPWVQQAQSDEERIARLALLFDSKEIDASINSGIAKLKKLQRGDGGWSWTENYDRTSLWATMLILNNFAELRQLGCYPAQLDEMVRPALKYLDKEIAADYARYPKGDYSFYSYIRSLYLDFPLSSGARKAYDATVQRTLKDWKDSNTAGKAADALLLFRSGYPAVARQILDSLREYALSTPQLGMWWDSLEGSNQLSLTQVGQTAFLLQAFNTVDSGCPEVDKIRQWLILNKIVQDWGTSVDAMACVTAILQCGTSWLDRPGDAVVTVDGRQIKADRMDKLTGQIVAAIPDAAGSLKITRAAEGPAWGAVVAKSMQVMRDVKAHSIPELSVSKELFVRTAAGWAPSDSFTVGDVVKVRLVIKSMRDMDYVAVVDNRSATFEPVLQTPRPVFCDGIVFYLENRDAATNLFIDRLPKGQYVIEYEMNVNNAGQYSSGIATIQSQYTPEMTAHSAGMALTVND